MNQKEASLLLKIPKWVDSRVQTDVCLGASLIYQCEVVSASTRGRTYVADIKINNIDVKCIFFKFGSFIQSRVKRGQKLTIEGKITQDSDGNGLVVCQPQLKDVSAEGIGKHHPKYPEKLDQGELLLSVASIIRGESCLGVKDDIMRSYGLLTESDLVRKVHLEGFLPQEKIILEHSIACIESYRLARSLLKERIAPREKNLDNVDISGTVANFESGGGFTLTTDQRNALFEISKSFIGESTSGLSIVGDVSVGKSITAALAIKAVVDAGYGAIVMQPNAILANQFAGTCEMAGIEDIQVITGSSKDHPSASCVVGTQAVLHRKYIGERKVGIVVVDEIQKFGTKQFTKLFDEHEIARCISMTATLMPRSIMRARIGGMKTIILRQTPKPRRVHTKVSTSGEEVRDFIKIRAAKHGEIIYLVHPSIDSDKMASVERTAVKLARWKEDGVLPDYVEIFVLHGKHTDDEKNKVINAFKNLPEGKSGIVISTSLLEIGFDHKAANTIVILEGAAHGLSGLHQLRGRVGRHGEEGYCMVFTANQNALPRLMAFSGTNDGFEIAEMDLKNRGYGELIGLSQSGKDLMQLDLTNPVHNLYLNDAIALYSSNQKIDKNINTVENRSINYS